MVFNALQVVVDEMSDVRAEQSGGKARLSLFSPAEGGGQGEATNIRRVRTKVFDGVGNVTASKMSSGGESPGKSAAVVSEGGV